MRESCRVMYVVPGYVTPGRLPPVRYRISLIEFCQLLLCTIPTAQKKFRVKARYTNGKLSGMRPTATAVWKRRTTSNHRYCAGEGELRQACRRPMRIATSVNIPAAHFTAVCSADNPFDRTACRHDSSVPSFTFLISILANASRSGTVHASPGKSLEILSGRANVPTPVSLAPAANVNKQTHQ
jgi:hypothetical protein